MNNLSSISPNLRNAIKILGSRLSTEERRMLLEIVGFAFVEGKIKGKEEFLNDDKEENEITNYEQEEQKTTNTDEDYSAVPF
jgi:hypothetical protein